MPPSVAPTPSWDLALGGVGLDAVGLDLLLVDLLADLLLVGDGLHNPSCRLETDDSGRLAATLAALMPYDGMFSLVVAQYGDGALHPAQGAGLHQFQDGRWVFIDPVDTSFRVIPTLIVL
jgi:hypothetical protein